MLTLAPWLQTVIDVLVATATVAVAIFAGVEIWKENKREARTEDVAQARASVLAYLIRRRLRSWLGPSADSENFLETWLRGQGEAGRFDAQIQAVEGDVREMATILGDTPKDVAQSINEATVLCLEGIRRLTEYAETERPNGVEIFAWIQMRSDAANDLRECVNLLESKVMDHALIKAEQALAARRESEEPFGQLAEALIARERIHDGDGGKA